MQIDNLVWRDIEIFCETYPKIDRFYNFATIGISPETALIQEFSGAQGSSTNNNLVLGHPRILGLTQNWLMFTADYLENKNIHTVTITAKF